MTNHDESEETFDDPQRGGRGEEFEEFREASADRPPSPDEEKAADRASSEVDVDAVADEYEHMTELGANVRGEGEIEPEG